MMYHQTDNIFNKNINKYGCLFFSLMDISEEYTGHNFIPKTIKDLYNRLIELGYMEDDCYVLDHQKVLQEALEVFDNHDKVSYVGARYFNGKESWGDKFGMYMVMQFKTQHGHSHFFRNHYDPYLPEIKFKNIMSIRYYNIGI